MASISVTNGGVSFQGLEAPHEGPSGGSAQLTAEEPINDGPGATANSAATPQTAGDMRSIRRAAIGPVLTRIALEEQLASSSLENGTTQDRMPTFALVEKYSGDKGWITGQVRGSNVYADVEHLINHLKEIMPEHVEELYVSVEHVDPSTGLRREVKIKLSRDLFGRIFVDELSIGDPTSPA